MTGTYYRASSYNVICDSCGFKYKAEQLQLRWDGFWVCKACWNPRQPQDLIKARTETFRLPYIRPRPEDVFVNVCTRDGRQGIAGYGIAGCAVTGLDLPE